MEYIIIVAAVFLLDFFLKKYIDRTCSVNEPHLCLHGKVNIQKYYNKGAAWNLFEQKPEFVKALQTAVFVFLSAKSVMIFRKHGKNTQKIGLALLLGGGLSNLHDRYTKGKVVDYIRFRFGTKHFRRLVFNVSDFFIFAGAILAVFSNAREE